MRTRRTRVMFAMTVVAAVAMLATGMMPAGAAPGAGVGVTFISPNLDNGFPCGLGNIAPMTSVQSFINNAVPGYANTSNKCTGTIYQTGTQNVAGFLGAGLDNSGSPFVLGGQGTQSGNYYYEEPCQVSPVDGSKSAQTGEAYGTLTLNLSQAAGVVSGASFAGPATVTLTFWWSRVGVVALVGLRNAVITAGSNTIGTSPGATGLAAAAFAETVSQVEAGCATGPAPAPGAIQILSGSLTITQ